MRKEELYELGRTGSDEQKLAVLSEILRRVDRRREKAKKPRSDLWLAGKDWRQGESGGQNDA
jgi:hypothetical protein